MNICSINTTDKSGQAMKSSVLAIIPARGGSKGVPRKNIANLGGLPLIAWSIYAASESSYVDRIIVSTEDEEIAEISKKHGAEVPFLRPKLLATDCSSIEDVTSHILSELEQREKYVPDVTVLLLPTHPFRSPDFIDQAIILCKRYSFSTSVVYSEYFNPNFYFGFKDGIWQSISSEQEGLLMRDTGLLTARAKIPVSFPKSADRETKIRANTRAVRSGDYRFLNPVVYFCITDPSVLIDIDTKEDLALAQGLVDQGMVPWTPKKIVHSSYKQPSHIILNQRTETNIQKVILCDSDNHYDQHVLTLEAIPSPIELRRDIDIRFPSLAQKEVFVRTEGSSLNGAYKHSSPALWLDSKSLLRPNANKAYRCLGLACRYFPDASHDEFSLFTGNMKTNRIDQEHVELELNRPAREGDELECLTSGSGQYINETAVIYRFSSASWNRISKMPLGIPYKPALPISFEDNRIIIAAPQGTTRLFIRHLRPGLPMIGEPLGLEPIKVEDFLDYDFDKNAWVNLLTKEAITGRQMSPKILRWRGRAFLPAKIDEDKWEILLDGE